MSNVKLFYTLEQACKMADARWICILEATIVSCSVSGPCLCLVRWRYSVLLPVSTRADGQSKIIPKDPFRPNNFSILSLCMAPLPFRRHLCSCCRREVVSMARRMENATVGECEEEGKSERSGIGDPCEYPLRSIHNTTKALPQES
jgi:hypothetical protein